MKQGRVIEAYTSQFSDPIIMRTGDALALGREDDEWPGWVWCTSSAGKSGWVPESFIQKQGQTGVARCDYDARELSVQIGDLLDLHELVNGWYRATDLSGQTGWVPERNINVL